MHLWVIFFWTQISAMEVPKQIISDNFLRKCIDNFLRKVSTCVLRILLVEINKALGGFSSKSTSSKVTTAIVLNFFSAIFQYSFCLLNKSHRLEDLFLMNLWENSWLTNYINTKILRAFPFFAMIHTKVYVNMIYTEVTKLSSSRQGKELSPIFL